MADIKALREKARVARELQDRRTVKRTKDCLDSLASSPSFMLSSYNNVDLTKGDEVAEKFAAEVVNTVQKVIEDYEGEFLDVCATYGLKRSDIRRVVDAMYTAYDLGNEGDAYDDKVRMVSKFLHYKPEHYEDIAIFK